MVDRPRPVDPDWLQEVERTYGEYQLLKMAATGERGIACQMQIEPESRVHLKRIPTAKSDAIAKALKPLTENLPNPLFSLWWDKDIRQWRSLMTAQMELPTENREVFERTGYGCLAAETSRGVIHICHAADVDIAGFPHKPIKYRWQLIKMVAAPRIRLEVRIFDRTENPYRFESFLNIAEEDQARVLYELAGQDRLYLTFYGDRLDYQYTKEVAHGEQQWQKIDEIAIEAINYLLKIPEERRDFDQAKIDFILHNP